MQNKLFKTSIFVIFIMLAYTTYKIQKLEQQINIYNTDDALFSIEKHDIMAGIEKLNHKISFIEIDIDSLRENISSLPDDTISIENKIDEVDSKIDTEVSLLKNDIYSLQSKIREQEYNEALQRLRR